MSNEKAYHKLRDVDDFDAVVANGFIPSTPSEIHWLGEGVYFFLEPHGLYWAIAWPFDSWNEKSKRRSGSQLGVILTDIDITNALDLRDKQLMERLIKIFSKMKDKANSVIGITPDGLIIDRIINMNFAGFVIKVIIANFNEKYKKFRIGSSCIFLEHIENSDEILEEKKDQVQACVRSEHRQVIGKIELYGK